MGQSNAVQIRIKWEQALLANEEKRYTDAVKYYDEIIELGGKKADLLYFAGKAAYNAGLLEKSKAYFDTLFSLNDTKFATTQQSDEAFQLYAKLLKSIDISTAEEMKIKECESHLQTRTKEEILSSLKKADFIIDLLSTFPENEILNNIKLYIKGNMGNPQFSEPEIPHNNYYLGNPFHITKDLHYGPGEMPQIELNNCDLRINLNGYFRISYNHYEIDKEHWHEDKVNIYNIAFVIPLEEITLTILDKKTYRWESPNNRIYFIADMDIYGDYHNKMKLHIDQIWLGKLQTKSLLVHVKEGCDIALYLNQLVTLCK